MTPNQEQMRKMQLQSLAVMDLFPNEQNFDLDKCIDKGFITA